MTELPTKCIVLNRTVQVNAQVQYIDFEGRSDGESLLKILSQLRPRRVIVVRGTAESTATIETHCKENVDARVFTPSNGETVDATSETHIYQVFLDKNYNLIFQFIVNFYVQVRLTDALVSQLDFQKGKDAELAWIDAQIVIRDSQVDAKPVSMGVEAMEGII